LSLVKECRLRLVKEPVQEPFNLITITDVSMNNTSKSLTALLILLLIVSIASLIVLSASAADPPAPTVKPDIPTPSVPQFTLTYADHSYDIPEKTTTSTDPYTGKAVTNTIPGWHLKNFTIDVIIKNQPYPSTINHGNASTLKYFIQGKGHFESEDHFMITGDGTDAVDVVASNSEYTTVSIPIAISEGAVDIRVQASLGYNYRYYYGLTPMMGWASANSDWSSVHTITIGDSVPVSITATIPPPTSTPTATFTVNPTQQQDTMTTAPTTQSSINSDTDSAAPQLGWLETGAFVALGLIVAALAVFLILSRRRIKALELKQNGA
jgi:hypothetical protein